MRFIFLNKENTTPIKLDRHSDDFSRALMYSLFIHWVYMLLQSKWLAYLIPLLFSSSVQTTQQSRRHQFPIYLTILIKHKGTSQSNYRLQLARKGFMVQGIHAYKNLKCQNWTLFTFYNMDFI